MSNDGNIVAFTSVPSTLVARRRTARTSTSGNLAGADDARALAGRLAALAPTVRHLETATLSADGSRVAYVAFERSTLSQLHRTCVHTAVSLTGVGAPAGPRSRFYAQLSAAGAHFVRALEGLLRLPVDLPNWRRGRRYPSSIPAKCSPRRRTSPMWSRHPRTRPGSSIFRRQRIDPLPFDVSAPHSAATTAT